MTRQVVLAISENFSHRRIVFNPSVHKAGVVDEMLSSIAAFATRLRYTQLPAAVVAASKARLLDSLACAIAADASSTVRIARDLAPPPAAADEGGRIVGSRALVAADAAAFATSCMIRDLDLNDDYPGGHPSDALGSVLAVAPVMQASGESLITSVVVTYETIIALLRSIPLRDIGWDQSLAISVGSAAGLSNLIGLDDAATRHAISMTAVANTALRATRAGQLSMWKGVATAYAVRNATFAVQLARAGMTGPEAPFTGRHGVVEMVSGKFDLPQLGGDEKNYRIPDVYTKCWPVAYSLQAVVWAGIELRKLVPCDAIESIEVHTYAFSIRESGSEPQKWDPRTRETADHSIPYVLARALLHGEIDHTAFEPEAFLDLSIRPLMQSITVHQDDEIEKKIRQNIVELRLVARTRGGATHAVHIVNPLGHEKNPLSNAEMVARFERLCRPALGVTGASAASSHWQNIEAAANVVQAFDSLLTNERRSSGTVS